MINLDGVESLTDEKKQRDHRGPYTTALGVVLKYNKVSTDTIRKAWTAVPVPKPPMVYIKDRDREEPNPADPGYNQELSQYNNKINLIIHTIYLMRGVDIFYTPDSIPGPETSEWYEGLEDYLDIPVGRLARKAAWLMHYVLDDGEKDEIIEDLMIYSGLVPEKKVDDAMTSFRNNGVQETDKQVSD